MIYTKPSERHATNQAFQVNLIMQQILNNGLIYDLLCDAQTNLLWRLWGLSVQDQPQPLGIFHRHHKEPWSNIPAIQDICKASLKQCALKYKRAESSQEYPWIKHTKETRPKQWSHRITITGECHWGENTKHRSQSRGMVWKIWQPWQSNLISNT